MGGGLLGSEPCSLSKILPGLVLSGNTIAYNILSPGILSILRILSSDSEKVLIFLFTLYLDSRFHNFCDLIGPNQVSMPLRKLTTYFRNSGQVKLRVPDLQDLEY